MQWCSVYPKDRPNVVGFCFVFTRRCFLLRQPRSDGGQPAGDGVHHQHPVQLQRGQRGASMAQCAGAAVHRRHSLSPSKEKEQQGHSLPQPIHHRYSKIYTEDIFKSTSILAV